MSRFFGIVIRMFFDEHPPPHFHAEYGDTRAVVGIQPIDVIESSLPPRGLSLVLEWAARNQQGLADNWELLRRGEPVRKLPPLV